MTGFARNKVAGGILLASLGAGAVAAALGSAPQASASCASFFGIGNSTNCFSTPTSVAIALGPGAQAYALGTLGSAISVGKLSFSKIEEDTVLNSVTALGYSAGAYANRGSRLGTSVAVGNDATAILAGGDLNFAAALGDSSVGYAGRTPLADKAFGNIAIAVGSSRYVAQAAAEGIGNIALNVFSPSSTTPFGSNVLAVGSFNVAASFFSRDSQVFAGFGGKQQTGTRNVAFSGFGRRNDIEAHGPGSIVGSLFQTSTTVLRSGPGVTINGRSTPIEGQHAAAHHAQVKPAHRLPHRGEP
ncbi:hypothetical protein [Mycolicibacterium aichiense]|uniref:Uncharacterized protein n=1 Tax=Mycolicibacterium aichiense TaxID=1799 RepID=A0AAD1MD27_9MYCO|nr:hypothetical protein [Mycolicibacterium aichiense]MCV7019500.1 hypothetical protein [Mycolicibacterium aichiense]BBX08190.1 hypothetical protein MAIC_29930 [Mycolicibacterium aichiense]STZ81994.1 Uncharacterised protein [Mycolicibacterium aichiense]